MFTFYHIPSDQKCDSIVSHIDEEGVENKTATNLQMVDRVGVATCKEPL